MCMRASISCEREGLAFKGALGLRGFGVWFKKGYLDVQGTYNPNDNCTYNFNPPESPRSST